MTLNDVKKILIARSDNLGDNILTLPLLYAAKNSFPNSEVHLLTSEIPSELFQTIEFIDKIIVKSNSNLKELFSDEKYDLFIAARPQKDEAVTAFTSRVSFRIGTAFRIFSFFYNVWLFEHRKDCKLHESEYNFNLLKRIKPEAEYRKFYDFNLGEKFEKDTIERFSITDKNFIIIHPGSKGSSFDLPIETMINFLNLFLTTDDEHQIILTGSIDEKSLCNEILQTVNSNHRSRIQDLSGSLKIRELAAMIKYCNLFVSNSTGPIHIAGVMNKKIIGFYPDVVPLKPSRWKPLSDKSVILTPGVNQSDMKKITADDIYKNAELLLKSR